MVQEYKKIGVTTDGYRGQRAILSERVIEGLQKTNFDDARLQLDVNSPQTIYLTDTNFGEGYYILLPDATTLWPNWQVRIINNSSHDCSIYYYTSNLGQLNLFKEVTPTNMVTCILLENAQNSDTAGTWTTLKTAETSSADALYRYTSYTLDPIEITWNLLAQEDSDESDEQSIQISLGTLLAGNALNSVYIKTNEVFAVDSDEELTLTLDIGTENDPDHFIAGYDLTTAVADTNFTKDLFNEILSTSEPTTIYATFHGTGLVNLISGSVSITLEKPKLIDPTILKNPIVQTQVPTGIIMNYAFDDTPSGYWRLNGSLLPNAATAVPEFVQKLTLVNNRLSGEKLIITETQWQNMNSTYGSCGKFAWVGSSLRFPKINCFIQGLSDLTKLGLLTEAGLPNITGDFRAQPDLNRSSGSGTGAFQQYNPNGKVDSGSSGSGWASGFNFDASRCSSVYGKSTTVTPLNIKYPYIISIYNKIQDSASLIVDQIIEDSVNKANITLNNLAEEGTTYLKSLRMPDYQNGVSGTFTNGQWIQAQQDSFIVIWGTDPYRIDVAAFVSPDAGTTSYVVGYFYSDVNSNTRGVSFTFNVPKNWYFKANFENGGGYVIYPLKGN